jgi:hypothetical protein
MFTHKTTLFGLVALLALGTLATAQGRGHRFGEGREGRFERRAEIRKFAGKLEITDAQRAQALAAAKAIAPIAGAARAEARTILENARKANPNADRQAIRESVAGQLKALKERTVAQVLPVARGVFDTLTVEQKDKLRAAAEKHGRTFDAERATKRLGRVLASPRAVQFLEARTSR